MPSADMRAHIDTPTRPVDAHAYKDVCVILKVVHLGAPGAFSPVEIAPGRAQIACSLMVPRALIDRNLLSVFGKVPPALPFGNGRY